MNKWRRAVWLWLWLWLWMDGWMDGWMVGTRQPVLDGSPKSQREVRVVGPSREVGSMLRAEIYPLRQSDRVKLAHCSDIRPTFPRAWCAKSTLGATSISYAKKRQCYRQLRILSGFVSTLEYDLATVSASVVRRYLLSSPTTPAIPLQHGSLPIVPGPRRQG